jgi:hypothetical protein
MLAAGALLASRPARGYRHVVQEGDTLAELARVAYGDARWESVLAAANGLDAEGGAAIVAGMWLEVPAPSHYRCSGSETWGELAVRFLGNAKRTDLLAGHNDAMPWIPPKPGQEIAIPFVLSHVALEGESTIELARRYLGDQNRAWQIDAYNERKTDRLRRGEVLLVPLITLTLTDAGRAEVTHDEERAESEGLGRDHDAQRIADAELPVLDADLRAGRYAEATARAGRLLGGGVLTKPQTARVHRAMLEAYAALGAKAAAAAACEAWRSAMGGSADLDPNLVSPKIRAACAEP